MKNIFSRITYRETLKFVSVYVAIFIAAKFGQYLFFEWKTSPAIIWPPTGIGLAIIWLYGNRYAIPIFLGLLTASLNSPVSIIIPGSFTTPIGQISGLLIGVYLLKRYKFGGDFSTLKNVVTFLGVNVFSCMVAPTISTIISFASGNLMVAAYISWSRQWAGYIFSSLVLFPLIISWANKEKRFDEKSKIELTALSTLMMISVYFLFWTPNDSQYSFVFFVIYSITLFWVGLRFSTRKVALSMFGITFFSILGLFLSPILARPLNTRLFATELFLLIVIPIFYAFSALIKERAATVRELKEALDKIDKENVAKTQFIAVLAHELRNPLAPVKTTLEILGLQNLESDTKQLIASAHHQVHSMRKLLDDLLDINRVTQGKFELQIESVRLCDMIKYCINSTADIYKQNNHTIKLSTECDNSIWLDVDKVRFEQVLVNILNNAAKYTEPGGVIDISHDVKGNSLELKVKDNGIGIDKEDIDEVFEPFKQIRNHRTNSGGIGVGLSLTKHIIELHNGRIEVESEGRGRGSTFKIYMPLPENIKAPKQKNIINNMDKYKILIVDDNQAAADALSTLLRMKGHSSEKIYSGMDTFKMIPQFEPDIVLLDIGLPDMSGYEVARKLRDDGFVNKIVALSGYGQKEDVDKAYQAGFDHHITKPMSIARLEEYLLTLA